MPVPWTPITAVVAVSASLLLGACAAAPPHRPASAHEPAALLARAINAHGGERALAAARVLHWTGTATVHAGGRTLELVVDTRVEPFVRAESTSRLRGEPVERNRILRVDARDASVERSGTRDALPESLRVHEHAQFGLYGLLRLLPLREAPSRLARAEPDAAGRPGIVVDGLGLPPTTLWFDADGRVARMANSVPAADGGAPVAQEITLEGTLESAGMRWFRILRIRQDGREYFELRIDTLDVARDWPAR